MSIKSIGSVYFRTNSHSPGVVFARAVPEEGVHEVGLVAEDGHYVAERRHPRHEFQHLVAVVGAPKWELVALFHFQSEEPVTKIDILTTRLN